MTMVIIWNSTVIFNQETIFKMEILYLIKFKWLIRFPILKLLLYLSIQAFQALFSGAQCQDKGPWAHTGRQEVPSKHQEVLLCCTCDEVLAQGGQKVMESLWPFLTQKQTWKTTSNFFFLPHNPISEHYFNKLKIILYNLLRTLCKEKQCKMKTHWHAVNFPSSLLEDEYHC